MKYFLTFLFFISISEKINAQEDFDLKTMIGFGCSASGKQSEVVAKFTYLLAIADFDECQKLLESENKGEKILAAFVCKQLHENRQIILSDEKLERVNNIYNSEEEISVCGGCKFYKIQIKKLLLENRKNTFYREAKSWFKMYLK